MSNLKPYALPTFGMLILIMFIILAYVRESVFLDKLLVCGFIVTTIYISRLRSKFQ
ncbi:hypothetical protein SAMN04487989_1088 [Bizionia echini]|uniref:Uncharacterized protein n=1 Tax=Bizionia echini TaxID=649333 RepID=A0A1I5DHB7_9FLAO|nr:hypothetical protein [Bizionia echini]SFN98191.1 hypothetical protein SAMN04487989_1088 [Bizionia echini]